jgi:cytochrome c oxidase subunit 2
MGFMLLALLRRRRAQDQPEAPDATKVVVVGGLIFPAVTLLVVFALTQNTLAALFAQDRNIQEDLVVEVIGHQWWWEVRYPNQQFTTANEIRIPVGQTVRVLLTSEDVIHSFWVPRLHGKLDLNPGLVNTMWLHADQAGDYWGECAEFCGLQHAKMQFVVVAEPSDRFAAWLERQQAPAPEPADPFIQEGQQIFLGSACVYCHAIKGTNASGDLGPDLTHLASRRTLGAGILPNTRGNLAGWIIDAHGIKPGNLMPPMDLSGSELQAMLAYLETLE